jgi:hypothetical protein
LLYPFLDNFSGHKALSQAGGLPDKLHIICLPADMASNHQPADMGIIAGLKVGYKKAALLY